jgi:hypothetical protein
MYENQSPHLLTCSVANWLPLFGSQPVVDTLRVYASWRFLQAHERLAISACVRQERRRAARPIGGGAGVVTRSVEVVFPRRAWERVRKKPGLRDYFFSLRFRLRRIQRLN